jgi:Phage integrase family
MGSRIAKLGDLPADITPNVLRHSFASLAADLGYNEPTIATLLGHKAHSITSSYVHSADAVLLAAADAVATATMKLMASDQAQPSCGISAKMDQSCGTNSPLYRCFRPTEIVVLIWLSPSGTSPEMISRVGRNHLLYRCFRPTEDGSRRLGLEPPAIKSVAGNSAPMCPWLSWLQTGLNSGGTQ